MKTEIAYTLDGKTRVTYQNFWYALEVRTVLGWRHVGSARRRSAALAWIGC